MASKEKIISIKPKGVTPKQYSALLLEINLMKRAWKPYGVDLQVSAPGLRNILKCLFLLIKFYLLSINI